MEKQMTDISLENVQISEDGKCANGRLEYDRQKLAPDSPELLEAVKRQLELQFKFKAAERKVFEANACSDGFRAASI